MVFFDSFGNDKIFPKSTDIRPKRQWSEILNYGIAYPIVVKINFLALFQLRSQIAAERIQAKNDITFFQQIDIFFNGLIVRANRLGKLVVRHLAANLQSKGHKQFLQQGGAPHRPRRKNILVKIASRQIHKQFFCLPHPADNIRIRPVNKAKFQHLASMQHSIGIYNLSSRNWIKAVFVFSPCQRLIQTILQLKRRRTTHKQLHFGEIVSETLQCHAYFRHALSLINENNPAFAHQHFQPSRINVRKQFFHLRFVAIQRQRLPCKTVYDFLAKRAFPHLPRTGKDNGFPTKKLIFNNCLQLSMNHDISFFKHCKYTISCASSPNKYQ